MAFAISSICSSSDILNLVDKGSGTKSLRDICGRLAEYDFVARVLVCAVGRGDFASIDRGHSHEHSSFQANDIPSRPHDCRYDGAQSRPCIPEQSLACLQAFRGVAGANTRYGNAGRCEGFPTVSDRERYEHLHPQPNHDRGKVSVPGDPATT
jgi:hypothetical protein